MWEILVLIALQLLAALVTFTTSEGILHPRSTHIFGRRTGLKRLSKKGIYLIIIYLATISFVLWQFRSDKLDKAEVTKKNNEILHIRDSTAKADLDSSTARLSRSFGEGLGKYGFKYDSVTKELKKVIRDSSKRIIINGPTPAIVDCDDPISIISKTSDTLSYQINICAGAADVKIKEAKAYVFYSKFSQIMDFNNLIFLKSYSIFKSGNTIAANKGRGNIQFAYHNIDKLKSIIVINKISFTGTDNKNLQEKISISYYDFETNKSYANSYPTPEELSKILDPAGIKL